MTVGESRHTKNISVTIILYMAGFLLRRLHDVYIITLFFTNPFSAVALFVAISAMNISPPCLLTVSFQHLPCLSSYIVCVPLENEYTRYPALHLLICICKEETIFSVAQTPYLWTVT